MSQIDIECEVTLDGVQVDVLLIGSCVRGFDRSIKCRVLKVLTPAGRDRVADIPQDAMPALEVRLQNAILSARVRDAHEEGA